MTQIKDTLGGLSDKAGELVGSEEIQKLMPYLLSGGIGAAAGGLMTGKRNARKGESRMSHVGRVLRNALITGGLGVGATALLRQGIDKTVGDPDAIVDASKAPTGPLSETARGVAFSPLTAVGAGMVGLGLTGKGALIGDGRAGVADDLAEFVKKLQAGGEKYTNGDLQRRVSPTKMQEIVARVGKTPEGIKELDALRRGAGLASGSHALSRLTEKAKDLASRLTSEEALAGKGRLRSSGLRAIGSGLNATPGIVSGTSGLLSKITRRGPLSTFGQSWPRRAGRGALGIGMAAIPAIAGALLTDKQEA